MRNMICCWWNSWLQTTFFEWPSIWLGDSKRDCSPGELNLTRRYGLWQVGHSSLPDDTCRARQRVHKKWLQEVMHPSASQSLRHTIHMGFSAIGNCETGEGRGEKRRVRLKLDPHKPSRASSQVSSVVLQQSGEFCSRLCEWCAPLQCSNPKRTGLREHWRQYICSIFALQVCITSLKSQQIRRKADLLCWQSGAAPQQHTGVQATP